MKTIWIILIIVQCIITYLIIGFGISLIYSKVVYGSWKGWAKEDSFSAVEWIFGWPFGLCLFVIILPFLIIEYILEKFAE